MARAFEVECLVCADLFYTTQCTSSLYSTSVIFIFPPTHTMLIEFERERER